MWLVPVLFILCHVRKNAGSHAYANYMKCEDSQSSRSEKGIRRPGDVEAGEASGANAEVNGHTALDLVKPVFGLFLDFPLSH